MTIFTDAAWRRDKPVDAPHDASRYAWGAGLLFVVALVAETVVAFGVGGSAGDSPSKIGRLLNDHRDLLLAIAALSVVYAAAFVVYLGKLYLLLRRDSDRSRLLGSLVLAGGALFVSMHAVSDIGITGLLGAKLASYSAQHDGTVSYTLYLVTYAIDSVGDVFGSVFLFAAGLRVLGTALLPRWLGWLAVVAGVFLLVQGPFLGGVVATIGLVLDLIGFLGVIVFVAVSAALMLRGRVTSAALPVS